IRVRRREQGLLIALEMAPRVVFAEEALAAEELLPPADLLRAAPFAAARPALPESPGLVAARRPPARAWPRLACEALWQAGAGWALAEATLARLRDPLDWAPDTLGGVELYRTVAGPERTFWRLALAADRAVTRGVRAAGRYRWVRADAARAGLEPALLPEHRLAAELRGAAGDWRWGVGLDWRGGASAGAGRRRLAGSFDLSASAGRALGPGELRLEVENLFADRLALRPNEVLSERRVGLVWRHAWSAR
ncbi:MAG: hypothetical protein FJY75_09645, partial [Candidatus Eisenbacteria bacterium]|nr:hypothetical protein [Candidatus Eisenbacteria bacterium]